MSTFCMFASFLPFSRKDEYYEGISPWHWHFTRNERNTMCEILDGRNRVAPSTAKRIWDFEGHGIVPTAYPRLRAGNVYAGMRTKIVSSQTFLNIVWISIYNVSRAQIDDTLPIRNESVLIRCLHLIIIAMQSSSNEFVTAMSRDAVRLGKESLYVGKKEVEGYSILELLLDLLKRGQEEFLVGVVPLLKCILFTLEGEGMASVSAIIDPWRADMISKTSLSQKEDTAKRRKKEAKERMAKIKLGFATTQSAFVDKHALDTSLSAGSEEKSSVDWRYPTGNCVICTEECDENGAVYATMGILQKASIEKNLSGGIHASSCGHLIHGACFDIYWMDLLKVSFFVRLTG